MCSVNGVFSLTGNLSKADEKWATNAKEYLKHRGPDENGVFRDSACFLGSNRFSITGVKTGKMPILNESGDIAVVQNGEVYNHCELKKELERKGHRFKTDSDTEVIVHAYEEYDVECFKKLRGMFAIAIYEKRKDRLVLARDRFGEKPLFYVVKNNRLYFASEANALLDVTDRRISRQALGEYLALNFCINHLIEGILRLRPGQYLVAENNGVKVTSYWKPVFNTDYSISFDEAVTRYGKILADIIMQMIPQEVKFGAFISGGMDSALITTMLMGHFSDSEAVKDLQVKNLHLVTSGLSGIRAMDISKKRDSDYRSVEGMGNELEYTRAFAKRNKNLRYHERQFTAEEFIQGFDVMVSHLPGGPVISTSFPLLRFSSREARSRDIKVCFSGDGADEILGGYRTSDPSEGYTLGNEVETYSKITGLFDEKEIEELVGIKNPLSKVQEHIDKNFEGTGKKEDVLFNRIRYMMSCGLVIDKHILEKGDGMTMAAPLEMRMPYLDVRSAEFLFSLPAGFFIQYNVKKRLLRELSRKYGVLSQICNRPKQRTSLPYATLYSKSQYSDRFKRILKRKDAKIKKYLNPEAVDRIFGTSEDKPGRIHSLLILESWLRNHDF